MEVCQGLWLLNKKKQIFLLHMQLLLIIYQTVIWGARYYILLI
ncbi:hypothetical protein Y888_15470 [Mixta calida B021323]|nr:hypothetical protein Y888_15470 [Mixta calida B021323]